MGTAFLTLAKPKGADLMVTTRFSDEEYTAIIKDLETLQKSCEEAASEAWSRTDAGFQKMCVQFGIIRVQLELARLDKVKP